MPRVEGQPISLPQKEAPQYAVIETICRNVEVVEIEGERRYRVRWKTEMVGEPAVCLFDAAEQVIHQHERVLENYLGTEIPLAADQLLKIPGETQKMTKISQELSSLAGQFIIPLTPAASAELKERAVKIRKKIGRATNAYKLKAQAELEKVFVSEDERERTRALLDANLAVLARTEECLAIVGGTTSRLRIVSHVKDGWEKTISRTFYEMAQIVKDLENGVYESHPRKREQLARHISGRGEYSLIGELNQISGPEYWRRIQSREVQRLSEVGDLLREEDDEKAKAFLSQAILKLERVVKEREEKGKK